MGGTRRLASKRYGQGCLQHDRFGQLSLNGMRRKRDDAGQSATPLIVQGHDLLVDKQVVIDCHQAIKVRVDRMEPGAEGQELVVLRL